MSIPMYYIHRYMKYVSRTGFLKILFSSIFNAFQNRPKILTYINVILHKRVDGNGHLQ